MILLFWFCHREILNTCVICLYFTSIMCCNCESIYASGSSSLINTYIFHSFILRKSTSVIVRALVAWLQYTHGNLGFHVIPVGLLDDQLWIQMSRIEYLRRRTLLSSSTYYLFIDTFWKLINLVRNNTTLINTVYIVILHATNYHLSNNEDFVNGKKHIDMFMLDIEYLKSGM